MALDDYKSGSRISDMNLDERPRERMIHQGAAALSNAELIAILLRTGVQGVNVVVLAQQLLSKYGGLRGLRKASFAQLLREKGMGTSKTAQLLAAVELGRRLALTPQDEEKLTIRAPEDVFHLVHYEMSALDQEELWVMNLDTRNAVIAIDRLYRGTLNTSTVRVAEIFKQPILRNAAAILLVHNHPSGNSRPSAADIAVTKSVRDVGALLEIKLLDHLVIGSDRFESIFALLD